MMKIYNAQGVERSRRTRPPDATRHPPCKGDAGGERVDRLLVRRLWN